MSDIKGVLGGHCNKTWDDHGALKFMVENYGVKSMIDVGCGPGGQVKNGKKLGIISVGVDGDKDVNPDVLVDFRKEPYIPEQSFDLGWSVEFLEHVHEDYMDNYMSIFKKCKYVICTASQVVSKAHVNCKPLDWWKEKFSDAGFWHSDEMLKEVLKHSTMKKKKGHKTWLEQTGMVYVNGMG